MVRDPAQVLLLLGREEGVFLMGPASFELAPWEKLLGLDWRGEAEAGRQSASHNAAALQQPCGQRAAGEPATRGRGPGRSPQRQEQRAGTSLTTEPVLCASGGSPRRWLSPLGLDCPSGESHGPQVGEDLPEGDGSLEGSGAAASRSELVEGSLLPARFGLPGALPGWPWSNLAHPH